MTNKVKQSRASENAFTIFVLYHTVTDEQQKEGKLCYYKEWSYLLRAILTRWQLYSNTDCAHPSTGGQGATIYISRSAAYGSLLCTGTEKTQT